MNLLPGHAPVRSPPRLRAVVAVIFFTLATMPCAFAQADAEMPLTVLEPAADARFPGGESSVMEARADREGQRYAVGGTDLAQPIRVSVFTRDGGHVRVRITKDKWEVPDRDLQTGGDGRIDLGFRTFDGFQVWVTADEPTDYQLITWIGEPRAAELPPIAEPASRYSGAAAATSAAVGVPAHWRTIGWVIAALVAGALLLLIGLRLGRRNTQGDAP